jgi:hypothetical protein
MITMGGKMGHHGVRVLKNFIFIPIRKTKLLGIMWVNTGDKACPGRITNRNVAMSLCKGNAAIYKFCNIWSLSLRMPTKGFDIVI